MTCAGIEDQFNISVEHSDALGKGKGETNRDEGTNHHCPTPAPLWRSVPHRTSNSRRHGEIHTHGTIPFIMNGENITPGIIGTRETLSDIGATVLDYFNIAPKIQGTTMLLEDEK